MGFLEERYYFHRINRFKNFILTLTALMPIRFLIIKALQSKTNICKGFLKKI